MNRVVDEWAFTCGFWWPAENECHDYGINHICRRSSHPPDVRHACACGVTAVEFMPSTS